MLDPKKRTYWYAICLMLISVILGSTAYLVFKNALARSPIATSFFWFTLFALIATIIYPEYETTKDDFRQSNGRRVINPFRAWKDSLNKGGWITLFIAAFSYSVQFYFLLAALKENTATAAITVLVIHGLRPVITAFFSCLLIGDTVKSWRWYLTGSIVCLIGIAFYRGDLHSLRLTRLSAVEGFAFAALISDIVNVIVARIQRVSRDINALNQQRSIQAIALMFALAWAISGDFSLPNRHELLALCYLGFVPTAVSGILRAQAQDVLGLSLSEVIVNLRPFAVILIGLLPVVWFQTDSSSLALTSYVGIILSIIGVAIVMLLAKPEPVNK